MPNQRTLAEFQALCESTVRLLALINGHECCGPGFRPIVDTFDQFVADYNNEIKEIFGEDAGDFRIK